MNRNIQFPQSPIIDPDSGQLSIEWFMWLQNPTFLSLTLGSTLGVSSGGTGLSFGTSGGILGFTAPTKLESSGVLNNYSIVFGGGAGFTPATPVGLGTVSTVLHGNASGVPSWGAVNLSNDVTNTLAVINGGTGLISGTSGGIPAYTDATTITSSGLLTAHALVLGGGAGFTPSTPVGLGTSTTILHGNATGVPTWGAVSLTADVSGVLPLVNGGTAANLTASNGGIIYSGASALAVLAGTATAGQILRSGASSAPTWSTATYPTTAGTGGNVLRSNGTNFLSAALGAADLSNGVTGTGAVVLASNAALTTPDIGVATGASINLTGGAVIGTTLQVGTLGAFVAGDKYVIVDASGNFHKSALGPAS